MKSSLTLSEFLPYQINRLAERASRSLATVYADRFGISVAQWRIVATLHERPALTARDVADSTNLDKVKVSRSVGDLIERGFVSRKNSQKDARASELSLTTRGERLFTSIEPLALEWEARFLSSLSAAEQTSLRGLLSRIEVQDRYEY
ncbi:MAG: MarR family transcriptional regulator [Congregibacter sp.]